MAFFSCRHDTVFSDGLSGQFKSSASIFEYFSKVFSIDKAQGHVVDPDWAIARSNKPAEHKQLERGNNIKVISHHNNLSNEAIKCGTRRLHHQH